MLKKPSENIDFYEYLRTEVSYFDAVYNLVTLGYIKTNFYSLQLLAIQVFELLEVSSRCL